MGKKIFIFGSMFLYLSCSAAFGEMLELDTQSTNSATSLLGEKLTYNISFLWFKKVALGELSFEAVGEKTYRATLKAKTRGVAAFFTSNRVETYTTLMEEGSNGLLRPIYQTKDTRRIKFNKETHRVTSYSYDYKRQQVSYRKVINGIEKDLRLLAMDPLRPTYDFLTAFYNFRLGRLGTLEVGADIELAAFTKKGLEEIVIRPLSSEDQKNLGFSSDLFLCKVLLSPEVFKTKSRDVYVGFDEKLTPLIAVIKDVIGLGDVKGRLIHQAEPRH